MPTRPAPTFAERKSLYTRLWATMQFDPGQKDAAMAQARRILANKAVYRQITAKIGVPWWFTGCVHMLEAAGNFRCHLGNGDPLTDRTVQEPIGIPKAEPRNGWPAGYTWEEGAIAALVLKGLDHLRDWSIEQVLYQAERYNGFGYALYHSGENTPYLWARTNHNDGNGKYIADGKWSETAPSEGQIGFAALLACLIELDPSIAAELGTRPASPAEHAENGGISTTVGGLGAAAAQGAGLPIWAVILIGVALAGAVFLAIHFLAGRKKD